LIQKMRHSDLGHADETYRREDGENVFVWYAGNEEVAVYRIDSHRCYSSGEATSWRAPPRSVRCRCLRILQRDQSGGTSELSRASPKQGEGDQGSASGNERTGLRFHSILPSSRTVVSQCLSCHHPHGKSSPSESHQKDASDIGSGMRHEDTRSSQSGDAPITIATRRTRIRRGLRFCPVRWSTNE
jgi:hypothetical protein